MKMLKKPLVIFFIIFLAQDSSCFIDSFMKMVDKVWNIQKELNAVATSKRTWADFATMIFNQPDANEKILDQLHIMYKDLQDFRHHTRDKLNLLESLIKTLPKENQIRSRIDVIEPFMKQTDEKWDSLFQYMQDNVTSTVLNDLAKSVIENTRESLTTFRSLLISVNRFGHRSDGLFKLIASVALSERDTVCDEAGTFHDLLAGVLKGVLMTEVKVHGLSTFAYHIRHFENKGWATPLALAETAFREHFAAYVHEFSEALSNQKLPYIRACDPKDGSWKRDETYSELTGFLQQTIYSGPEDGCYRADSCKMGARNFHKARGTACEMKPASPHASCKINLRTCSRLSSYWHSTHVCLSTSGPYKIQWVEDTKGKIGVSQESCSEKNLVKTSVASSATLTPTCSCQCDDKKYYVDSFIVSSNTADNLVIVGVRLRLYRSFIMLEIKQGTLGPRGQIQDSRGWNQQNMDDRLTRYTDGDGRVLLDDNDEETMTFDKRSFFLDDLKLPSGYVLTGMRLRLQDRNGVKGYAFEIVGAPFDYETGEIAHWSETLVQSPSSAPGSELSFKAQNSLMMKPYETHNIISEGYSRITLQQSDLDTDFGQSLLPLLDTSDVQTKDLLIGGAGLFHRGYKDYAGFLSIRLFPFDYLNYTRDFIDKYSKNPSSVWNS